MKHCLFIAVLILGYRPAVSIRAAEAAAPRPPPIVYILAGDHRADGLHALGNPLLQTPNLDTFVERGTTFTRCYTMGSMIGAVCTPSRV